MRDILVEQYFHRGLVPQVRVHRLDANLGPRLTRAEEQAGLTTRHFELAISYRPLPGCPIQRHRLALSGDFRG